MTSPVFRAFEAQSTAAASAKSPRKSANHLAVTTALGFGILALGALIAPGTAYAACSATGAALNCETTTTTDSAVVAFPSNARSYTANSPNPAAANVSSGSAVDGFGLAFSINGGGSLTVTNNGIVTVNAGNTATAGGRAALNITSASGALIYQGNGAINNLGTGGDGLNLSQTGSAGISVTTGGNIQSANGPGLTAVSSAGGSITIAQAATSTISGTLSGANLTVTGGNIGFTVNGKVTASAGVGVSAINNPTFAAGDPPTPTPNAGTITINTGTGSQITGTGANGITTDSGNSTGATNIIVGGEIIAKDQTGIKGTSTAGNIIVNVLAGAKVDPLIGVDLSTVSGLLGVPNAGAIEGDNIGVRLTSTGAGAVGALSVAQSGTGSIKVLGPAGAQGVVLSGVDANLFVTGNGGSTVIDAKLGTIGVDVTSGGAGNINISDNIISGGTGGILAVENGSGTGGISITGTGNVTGTTGNAIDAQIVNAANGSNIRIDRRGVISGGAIGVSATTQGTGEIYVSTDAVSGAAGQGILASGALSTLVTVVANGNVTGTTTGIDALGSGDTFVTLNSGTTKGGVGVSAVSNSGNAGIALVSGAAIMGTSGNGATVSAANGVNVLNNGAITGANRGLEVTASGANGLFISGSGTFTGQGTEGINANNLGAGVTDINISGAVVGKTSALFVRDTAVGGDITIKAGAVSGSTGIDAVSVSNAGNISITGSGAVVGTAGTGIDAGNTNGASTGAVSVTTGAGGTVNGTLFGIRAARAGTGSVTVNAGAAVTADTKTGISAASGGGDVKVTSVAVTSTGSFGVAALSFGANTATGLVSATTNGAVSGTGGILAVQQGVGDVTVNANANVTATAGDGITAFQTGAAGNAGKITVNQAAGTLLKATGGNGIITNSGASTGLTTITANGNITSTTARGVDATSNGGGVTINQAAGSTITAAVDSIKVNNTGSGAINVNALGTLVANNGSGVFVNTTSATADPITVTTNIVKSTGGAGTWGSQVKASAGTGDIIINSNGAMGSASAPSSIFGGILALTNGTSNRNVTVNVNADIGTATDRNAATAAQVQVSGTSSTTAKTLAVNINNASIFGVGGAVLVSHGATSLGDIKITGTGAGTLSATGGNGVNARILNAANAGNILVDVTQNVVGDVRGISATTAGAGNIIVNAGGNVTATAAVGINAINSNAAANAGTITVTTAAGKLVTATGGNGITTDSGLSTGATIINVNGEVTAPGQTGVKATSTAGSITLNVSATGKIDPVIGTDMTTAAGVLTINNAGLIMGDTTGAKLTATGTGTVVIANTGTITGGTDAILGSTAGTAFTLGNTAGGILNGSVNVTGSSVLASAFNNGGTWNASGASNFSGALTNSGTTNVANGAAITIVGPSTNSGTLRFAGNGTVTTNLTNSGIITAQNGVAGNNAITITGTYTGGGQFLVDANTATATADVMRITGAASGNTNVGVNLIGRGFLASGFLPIVFVTPGAAAGTFTSNTVFSSGILTESFGQNPANSGQFGILQSFNPNTAQLAGLSTIASSVSNFIDEPTSVYVTAKANPSAGDHQFGFWGRGGAGNFNQNLSTAFSTGATGLGTVTRRVSTNYQMLQAGFDYGMLNMGGKGWNLHLGVTGGNMDSSARETAGSVQYDASFVGGYAFLSNGAFTLDGGLRREWRNFKIFNQTVLGNASPVTTKGRATAGSVSASYRIGFGTGFALTPSASLNFSDGNIDSFAVDALTRYSPGSDKSLVGRAGARLSYKMQPRGRLILEEYVGVHALRNFSNLEASSVLFAGATTTNFGALTTAYRDAVQYSAGIKATNETGRIGAFIEGNWNSGNGVEGGSMSIGARVNF
jgi:hypothetical protein